MELSEEAKRLYGALISERSNSSMYGDYSNDMHSGETPYDHGKPDVVAQKDAAKYTGDRGEAPLSALFKKKQAERDKLKYGDKPISYGEVMKHTNASGSSPEMHY